MLSSLEEAFFGIFLVTAFAAEVTQFFCGFGSGDGDDDGGDAIGFDVSQYIDEENE